jgi:hypothetical protein
MLHIRKQWLQAVSIKWHKHDRELPMTGKAKPVILILSQSVFLGIHFDKNDIRKGQGGE